MLLSILANDHLQHQRIGNTFYIVRVLLRGLLQRSLGLLGPAKVQLRHGLCNEGLYGRGRGCLCELFEDVKRILVFATALLLSRCKG